MEERRLEILEMVQEGRIDARTGAELMETAEECPSTEEALRILRMFRENKVTMDEAKELLIAMGRPESKEEPPETALREEKDKWTGLARWRNIAIAVSIGTVVLVFLFFVTDFGGVFTPGGRYLKLVCFSMLAFAGIIGAIAYFLARRRGEIWLPPRKRKKPKGARFGKSEVMETAAARSFVIPLIFLDAICILFALWLLTTPGWRNLLVFPHYYLRHFLNLFSTWALVITGIFILSFALFGLYGRKGGSLVRIFCAVALPLLLFWFIQHAERNAITLSYHILAPPLSDYHPATRPLWGLGPPKSPRDYYISSIGALSHFNQKLLFSGLLCFLFVAGYRKIFFTRFARERVIEVERSG